MKVREGGYDPRQLCVTKRTRGVWGAWVVSIGRYEGSEKLKKVSPRRKKESLISPRVPEIERFREAWRTRRGP